MKTSNKILLGIFLATLLLTTTINLIVYAKYKRGEYVPFIREEKMVSVKLPAPKFVSVNALCNVEIMNSDTFRIETRKDEEGDIIYRVSGDTIVFQSKNSFTTEQMERGECNHHLLKLFMPATVQANFVHGGVRIQGNEDSTKAPSFNINLNKNSYLMTGEREKEFLYINQLLISGNGANVDLGKRLIINDLNLKLVNDSKFDSKKATIKNLTLDVDNSSTINLTGFSIKNIK